MKHGLLIALFALSGCQTMQRHPYLTAFVATSLAISSAKALDGRRDGQPSHDVTIQPVACTGSACK